VAMVEESVSPATHVRAGNLTGGRFSISFRCWTTLSSLEDAWVIRLR